MVAWSVIRDTLREAESGRGSRKMTPVAGLRLDLLHIHDPRGPGTIRGSIGKLWNG